MVFVIFVKVDSGEYRGQFHEWEVPHIDHLWNQLLSSYENTQEDSTSHAFFWQICGSHFRPTQWNISFWIHPTNYPKTNDTDRNHNSIRLSLDGLSNFVCGNLHFRFRHNSNFLALQLDFNKVNKIQSRNISIYLVI